MGIRLNASVASMCGREAVGLLANTSLLVKIICGLIILAYPLSFSEGIYKFLTLNPEMFWPPHFWLWTAITHCFIETHFWQVLINVGVIILVGKLLEPLWGTLEMMIFFAIVNIGVAVMTSIIYYFLFFLTRDIRLIFHLQIHGMTGYLAGVTVAVKQVMPDNIIARSPIGKITNRNIPLLVLTLYFVLWIFNLLDGSFCVMFANGLIISWCYLRFYQTHNNGTKGDMAETFAFHTFFPNVIQPPIAIFSNTIFAILVKLHICQRPIRKYDMGAASSSISISLPGVESHDTERRRQIALKALSERLNKVEEGSGSVSVEGKPNIADASWPSLDEDEKKIEIPNQTTNNTSTSINIESVHEPTHSDVKEGVLINVDEDSKVKTESEEVIENK